MIKNLLAVAILIILAFQFSFAYEKDEAKKIKPNDKDKPERSEDYIGSQKLSMEMRTTAEGRYYKLIKKIKVTKDKDDIVNHPLYIEYGYLDNDYLPAQKEYYGHKDVPAGFWVYVYPYWYIWAEQKFY